MASLTAGLLGGLVATVVMTMAMMLLGDGGPPPTAALVAKFAGGSAEDRKMPGMLLHLLYGVVAGGVFAVGVPLLGPSLDSLVSATALGVLYGLVLMVVGMVFWMRLVIGLDPDGATMRMFGVVHVIYGAVLGAFLGAGTFA